MNTIQLKAMEIAKEVSVRFETEFGYKPIIAGSLSLILHGFIPRRYKDVESFKMNDADITVEDTSVLKETVMNPLFTNDIVRNMIEHGLNPAEQIIDGEELSIPNVNYIGDFVSELQLEVYPMNNVTPIGDNPRWIWIDGVKVQNPMLALHAKAGYVLEELGQAAQNKKYQKRKNARITKHYRDIVEANFDLPWNTTKEVDMVEHWAFQNIVAEYMMSHSN